MSYRKMTLEEVEKRYGKFAWQELAQPRGAVLMDPTWVKKNIVYVDIPILGMTNIHKDIKLDFFEIFAEIEKEGLSAEIKEKKDDGTWCARHVSWNPDKLLSYHSWGIAIDLNWTENALGTDGNMDSRIVSIFEKHGWIWGGRWTGKNKDPMHFEVGIAI